MNKKRFALIAVCVVLAAAVVAGAWYFGKVSRERAATQQEIDAHAVYYVDWSQVPGWQEGMTEREFILSLCTYESEETVEDVLVIDNGMEEYRDILFINYTSDTLGRYLYRCNEILSISDYSGGVSVIYTAEDGDWITLRYSDAGPVELLVCDEETDNCFVETGNGAKVYLNFRNGIQLGDGK